MDDENKIEYYLGKVRYPNLHWNSCIPPSWFIPARVNTGGFHSELCKSQIKTDFYDGRTQYKFNNLGYRSNFDYTEELFNNGKKNILSLGCSDAFGQMVDYEQTYNGLLETMLPEYNIISLSVAGASPDMATRIGFQSISYVPNIESVIMLWPVLSLREFVSKKVSFGVHTLDNENLPYKDWWEHIDWVSNNYNYQKNKALIENACKAKLCDFYDLHVDREDSSIKPNLLYFGPYSALNPIVHKAIANYFYKKITNQKSLFESTQS
jgi:hypothetical protein